MMSAEKGEGVKKCSTFADKQYRFCGWRGGQGVKKSQNYVDFIYGNSLMDDNLRRGRPVSSSDDMTSQTTTHYVPTNSNCLHGM